MADVVVTILINDLSYTSWLRTSYVASALKADDGSPLVISNELGVDQEDAFSDFMEEASREVNKLYVSRQGDATGVPFEYTPGTSVTYRFKEETPVLPHASSIKENLNEDTKNALFTYVTLLWYKLKLNSSQIELLRNRYEKVAKNIDRHLYKLHD